jgi:autotransporter-associated beta strand protein
LRHGSFGKAKLVVACVGIVSGAGRLLAADVSSNWIGTSGSWNVAGNWANSPAVTQFPNNGNGGFTYEAVVGSGAGTVALGSNITIESLTLNGGAIDNGGHVLDVNQAMNWSAGNLLGTGVVGVAGGINITAGSGGSKTLSAILVNSASANWLGSGIFGSGTIINPAGALFNIQPITGSPTLGIGQFTNSGTVSVLAPTGAVSFGGVMTLNNTGTLDVIAGSLNVNGTVTQVSSGTLTGGTWNVGGTLTMPFGGAVTTIGSGASVKLSGSPASFTKIDGLTTNQGTFAITGGRNFTTTGPFSNTGTLSVGSSSTLTVTTSLTEQTGNTLTAGTYVVGGTLVLPGGPINVNQADFTLDGASSVCTDIDFISSNLGTFTLLNGRTFTTGAFGNAGTVHVGSSSTSLVMPSGGTHTGSFVVDSGGAITLNGGTHTFNGSSTFSGAGTLNINSTVVLTGNANITAPTTTNWNGGTIGGGGGKLTIPAGATFRTAGAAAKTLNGTIDNNGTTQWMGSSGVFGSGTFNNLSGASFQVFSGSSIAFGVGTFNNAGTVTKTTTGTNNFGGATTFHNTGTVDVSGGTLSINGAVPDVSSGTLTAGTWKATNATLALNIAGNVSTIGSSAAVALSGSTSVFANVNPLANNQGGFTITNSRNFTTAGALSNSGTLVVGPGSALTVSGTFTNSGNVSGDGVLGAGVINASSYAMQSGSVAVPLIGSGALTKTTSGTATLSAANTYTGGTSVAGGKLVVTRLHENNAVNILAGTLQVMDSSPTLPNFPSGDNAFVSRPGSMIAIGSNGAPFGSRVYNGALDLGNNDLIIDYSGSSPFASLSDMVRSGFNFGDWLGKGVTSSTAANPLSNGNYALGVAENGLLTNPFGADDPNDPNSLNPKFDNQTVDNTTVLVKFTHRVDLDLDGLVTGNDAAVFNGSFSEGDGGATWQTGDVDYDGTWSSNDAAIFNSFYDESLAHLPEPGALVLVPAAALRALRRRRR